jgi:capsular exopolysaccharide synthesis family protein
MTPNRSQGGAPAPDYLVTLRRRKWWLIGLTLLVPMLAVVLSLRQHKVYEAKAEVVVNRQNLAASLAGTADTTAFQDPTRFVETQARIASIPEVAARTLRALGLNQRTVDDLLANSDVTAEPNVDLLAFRVRDRNPLLARRLASEYAKQFSRYHTEVDTASLSRTLDEVRARINDVQSRGGASSALLRSLVDKEQQLQTLESLQAANAFLVRPADAAGKVKPRPLLNGLVGGLLGLGLGLGLVFLIEAVDTRVRSGEELTERLGLPLLGRISEPPRRLRSKNDLVMVAEPESVEAEAFRMLRTNVDFANLDRDAKVIMVSSAVGGEGKSTTAANLAVSFARAGRRVLLAELDLRRPNLGSMLKTYPAAGLVDVLLGYATLDDAIEQIQIAGGAPAANGRGQRGGEFEFLAAGPAPTDVGEMFGSRKLGQVLDAMRSRADVVLLDAPPLLLVGDAMALSAQADALILIAKPQMIRRPMVKDLRRFLDATPTEKLGVVLTGDSAAGLGYAYAGYPSVVHVEHRSVIDVLTRRKRKSAHPREPSRSG